MSSELSLACKPIELVIARSIISKNQLRNEQATLRKKIVAIFLLPNVQSDF